MKPIPLFSPRRMLGFSLVELMIAMVIGLVVMAGVASIFVSSRQAFRSQEALQQVQETGRYLSYAMYPYIRLAGYLPDGPNQPDPALFFPAGITAISGTDDASSTIPGVGASAAGTDTITIRYYGQDDLGGNPDGSIMTCLGAPPGEISLGADRMSENTFYVGTAEDGVSSLNCATRILDSTGAVIEDVAATGNPEPLLLGVQDMQILYGIDNEDVDRLPNQYVPAGAVTDWNAVASVRITLTVDAAEQTAGTTDAAGAEDGRLRRVFNTTVQIRNRLTS